MLRRRYNRKRLTTASSWSATAPVAEPYTSAYGVPTTGRTSGPAAQYHTPITNLLTEGLLAEHILRMPRLRRQRIWQAVLACDGVAGTVIPYYADLPWSDVILSGIDDPAVMQVYQDAIEGSRVIQWLPEATASMLGMGHAITHLLVDESKGNWIGAIQHNPEHVDITDLGFLGSRPLLDLDPGPTREALQNHLQDPRVQRELRRLPPNLVSQLSGGRRIPLHPSNTIFWARKLDGYDTVGHSIFLRMAGALAIDQAVMLSTTSSLLRIAGGIRHVKVGTSEDGIEEDDYQYWSDLILQAEADLLPVIATPDTVSIDFMATGGQVENIRDWRDYILSEKLLALGVTEQFAGGEDSYNQLETRLSVFMDRLASLRDIVIDRVILQGVLAPIAAYHGFYKDPRKAARDGYAEYSNLLLPKVTFRKPLQQLANMEEFERLQALEDLGVEVPLQDYAKALNYQIKDAIDGADESHRLRAEFAKIKEQRENPDLATAVARYNRKGANVLRADAVVPDLALQAIEQNLTAQMPEYFDESQRFRGTSAKRLAAAVAELTRLDPRALQTDPTVCRGFLASQGFTATEIDSTQVVAIRSGVMGGAELSNQLVESAATWVRDCTGGTMTQGAQKELEFLNALSAAQANRLSAEPEPEPPSRPRLVTTGGNLPPRQLLSGV